MVNYQYLRQQPVTALLARTKGIPKLFFCGG